MTVEEEFVIISRNKNYWLSRLDDNTIRLIFAMAFNDVRMKLPENCYYSKYNTNFYDDLGLIDNRRYIELMNEYIHGKYITADYYENGIFYFHITYRRLRGDYEEIYYARRAEDVDEKIDINRDI